MAAPGLLGRCDSWEPGTDRRRIVMNLRAKEAQDAMHKLIKEADVFVEN